VFENCFLQDMHAGMTAWPAARKYEKESCFAGFSACGGSHKRHLPLRRSVILAKRFYFIGKQFPMK